MFTLISRGLSSTLADHHLNIARPSLDNIWHIASLSLLLPDARHQMRTNAW